MKNIQKRFLVLATILSPTVASYADAPVANPMAEQTSKNKIYELRVSATKQQYDIEKTIDVTIVLKNISDKEVRLLGFDSIAAYKISLLSPKNINLPSAIQKSNDETMILKGAKRGLVILQPKEEVKLVVPLNKLFEITEKGVYTLSVEAKVPNQDEQGGRTEIKSTPLKINVAAQEVEFIEAPKNTNNN